VVFEDPHYQELWAMSEDALRAWLAAHPDLERDAVGVDGISLLHHAVVANATTAVEILAATDVDHRDRWGNTALWRAVFHLPESADALAVLLAAGADPDVKNNHDVSPRDLADALPDSSGIFDVTAPAEDDTGPIPSAPSTELAVYGEEPDGA
jgi:hypothetical protein